MADPWKVISVTPTVEQPNVAQQSQPTVAVTQPDNWQVVSQQPNKPLSWADVPEQMLRNLPSSAGNFVGGVYQTVRHPIDTLSTLGDVATGAIQKVRNLSPEGSRGSAPAFDTSTFDAAKKFFVDRFGSEEGFKKALATDPVGVAGDLSTLLSGGAAIAPKAGGIAAGLKTAANLTNPVTGLIEGLKAVGPTSGLVATQGLGMATGVGPENIATAFKAGKEGTTAFMENMAGRVAKTDVLDQARQALANMRATRSSEYKTNIATTAADTTPLKFNDIDTALQKVTASLQQGGHSKIGSAETTKVDEVASIIKEWRDDPAAHTASGLDALKQRLDAVYPESPVHNQAQRVITTVRNAVKDTIVKQSPEYASTMKAYEEAISLEKEIERALSLGQKASADTALRKLTSLGRNNVNANYGYRLDLAKALEQGGNADLMPAIAGQTMSSWTPRGLTGQLGAPATAGAALMGNPLMAAALPFMSPRLVGEGTYRAGQLANLLQPATTAASQLVSKIPMTKQQAALAALLSSQAGNAAQQPNK
jgi:hypothetical protein